MSGPQGYGVYLTSQPPSALAPAPVGPQLPFEPFRPSPFMPTGPVPRY
jgi:hypothetical protein